MLTAVVVCVLTACEPGSSAPTPTAAPPPTQAPSARPSAASPEASPNAPIRIPLSGAAPDAIALDGDTAWVLAGEGGTLMEVDLAGRRELRSIEVGFGATHLALPAAAVAAVARFDNSATGTFLPIVDLESGSVTAVSTRALGGLAAGEGGVVWALERDGMLLKIDVARGRALESVAVQVGQNVHTEVQWGAGAAWVGSDGTPTIRIDDDLTIEATIEVETGLPFLVDHGLV